jgi:hypothetical protein
MIFNHYAPFKMLGSRLVEWPNDVRLGWAREFVRVADQPDRLPGVVDLALRDADTRGRRVEYRTQVAYHEAAHIVVSVAFRLEVPDRGIDLDSATSVEGAHGNALVNLIVDDPGLSQAERRNDLVRNLAIVCAGAASDARLLGRSLRDALRQQPSDESVALDLIRASPLLSSDENGSPDTEGEFVLALGLETAESKLQSPSVWAAVETIAKAAVRAGGQLTRAEIQKNLKACGLAAAP